MSEKLKTLSKKCWDEGHGIYEDMIIYENCEERVFFCRDCKKVWICVENGKEFLVKEELPITVSNKTIGEKLTWLP